MFAKNTELPFYFEICSEEMHSGHPEIEKFPCPSFRHPLSSIFFVSLSHSILIFKTSSPFPFFLFSFCAQNGKALAVSHLFLLHAKFRLEGDKNRRDKIIANA